MGDEVLVSGSLGASSPELPVVRRSRLRRFASNKAAIIAAIVLLAIVIAAVLAPWITPKNPNTQDLLHRFKPPGHDGLLGTDELGRDVFSRLIIGARVSLVAAGEVTIISIVIGVPLGMLAGFHGGMIDAALSRAADAVMSVPFLLLALTVISVVGYGLAKSMAVVGVVLAPGFFRLTRGVTQEVRRETYIESSTAIGCSTWRTLIGHVLPNSLAPLIVQTTVTMSHGVTIEASLSFLGLGAAPPTASWGSMLQSALQNYYVAPYLVYPPGLMITITVLSLTLFGDGVGDALGTRRLSRRRDR